MERVMVVLNVIAGVSMLGVAGACFSAEMPGFGVGYICIALMWFVAAYLWGKNARRDSDRKRR